MATTNPTFPQMQHFFRLVDEKKITSENFQRFLESVNKFVIDSEYVVTVDYSQSLVEMITAGRYESCHDCITVEHFPLKSIGKVEVKLRLVHLGLATTEGVLEYLNRQNLRPATIEELLAFGVKYPGRQKEFPVVALGSIWTEKIGNIWGDKKEEPQAPLLCMDGPKRRLGLSLVGSQKFWDEDFYFLAVSK